MALNLIPPRVAFVDESGRLTREAVLFFNQLFNRVGGSNGMSNDDLALLSQFETAPHDTSAAIKEIKVDFHNDQSAQVAELAKMVEELKAQVADISDQSAALSEVKKYAQDMEIAYSFAPPPTDWEHPGKIGAGTANSGAFTTLTASSTINFGSGAVQTDSSGRLGLNATPNSWLSAYKTLDIGVSGALYSRNDTTVEASITANAYRDTGATWRYKIAGIAAAFGIDGTGAFYVNTASSGSAGGSITFSTKLSVSSTGAAVTGTLTSSGGFGCNGSPARTPYALPADATDLATCMTLANNIKLALKNNGICS